MADRTEQPGIRLNKFLAAHLHISRRQADSLIEEGRVTINGHVVAHGARVHPIDKVAVDGRTIDHRSAVQHIYLLLNKPVGYICSRRQQGETPTIYALLPAKYQHLQSAGRLDRDSSGLLLLTDDGDMVQQLTHPRFGKRKRYEVELDKPLEPLHRQFMQEHGILLPDGPSRLELERLHDGNDHAWLVTMFEGRNRQIRRTFSALGYSVRRLHRIELGTLTLDGLQAGEYREVQLQNNHRI